MENDRAVIIERLNIIRRMLTIERNDFLNNKNYGMVPIKRFKRYVKYVNQNVEQNILNTVFLFNNDSRFNSTEILEAEMIRNIGNDEYEDVFKGRYTSDTMSFGLSYHEEVQYDAYDSFINRFFDEVISYINIGYGLEETIDFVLASEASLAEIAIQNKNSITKDPRVRINELCEMATRERGNNDIACCSGLFESYSFNLAKILGIPESNIPYDIRKDFMYDVFNIRDAIMRRNRDRQQQNRQQQNNNQNQGLFNKSQIDSIKRILRNWGESLSSIYLNCVKSFLSTYADNTVEDPIKDFCLAIDNNIKSRTVMKDEKENEFKTKIENYLKNTDKGDLDIIEAVVKINEVKQALNEKSLFVRLGDFIIEQINTIKNPQITR